MKHKAIDRRTTLSADDVRLIRALAAERERMIRELKQLTNKSIAQKFGVTRGTIEDITTYKTWVNIK